MSPSPPATQQHLAVEAVLAAGPCRFVRERLRLPMGREASFGWLRHPPSVLVVPWLEDGRLLLMRRWRPAVGQWVLEFPACPLLSGESPAEGAERLLEGLIGRGNGLWHPLGELWPNPGYSDERMTIGSMALELEGSDGRPDGELSRLERWRPRDLEAAFSALAERVDSRSVSAWFLARRREGG